MTELPVTEPPAIEPAVEPAGDPPVSGRHRVWLVATLALALVLVGLLVAGVVTAVAVHRRDVREVARRQATDAAVAAAPKLGSINYTTLDADRKGAEPLLTPSLRAQYAKIFDPATSLYTQQKVVSRSVVRQAQALSDDSPTQVRVLVFFDQQSTSARRTAPQLTPYAFIATMQRQPGGAWLVGSFESVV